MSVSVSGAGVAAARRRETPSFVRVLTLVRSFGARPLVIEGAGGLFVPIDTRRGIIDLIEALNVPVLLVARAGLGTLNHTGLSLDALARRRIVVRAVVLTKVMGVSAPSEQDNAEWLRRRHGTQVLVRSRICGIQSVGGPPIGRFFVRC